MADAERAPERRPSRGGAVVWWAIYTALYVSFTGWAWSQLIAGALVAALSVGLSSATLRAGGLSFAGSAPRIWRIRAVVAIVVSEAWAVIVALARQLRGGEPVRGRFVAFRAGERIDPAADASVTLEASLAPNTYVVAVVGEDDPVVLVHQFAPRPQPRSTFPRWRP